MKRRFFFSLVLLGAMAALLIWSDTVRQAVQEGLALCAQSVIPSLFPFFVVSALLVSLGFAQFLGRSLEGFMRVLFHVGGNGAAALVLGLAGGYPVGARTAADLYRQGLCTRQEAERLLGFCNNCSPAFAVSILGWGVFHSGRAGVWLYLIHVFSALLTGMLLARLDRQPVPRPGTARKSSAAPASPSPVSLSGALVGAVQSGLQSILGVCAFVVLFMVVLLPLRAVPGHLGDVLVGAVELFNGANRLTADRAGFLLASALLGWGGLSVHCQTLSVLSGSGLSTRSYWLGKALQGLFSAALAWELVALGQA